MGVSGLGDAVVRAARFDTDVRGSSPPPSSFFLPPPASTLARPRRGPSRERSLPRLLSFRPADREKEGRACRRGGHGSVTDRVTPRLGADRSSLASPYGIGMEAGIFPSLSSPKSQETVSKKVDRRTQPF